MGLTKNLGWLSKYITADSNGQIGIGTTTPTFIGGFTALTVNSNSNGSFIDLNNSNTNNFRLLALPGGDIRLQSSSQLRFDTNSTECLRLNSSGQGLFANSIAIGGSAVGLAGINMPNQNYLSWYASGVSGAQYVAIRGNGSNLELSSGGGLTMTMDSAQRVGIGTGVPYSKVHIEGLFGTSGDALRIQNTTGYTTGNRSNIDFWFKSAAWTNARTAQIAAVTSESYWPNTDISFSVNANTSATALKEVMKVRQDGAVSNNGVLTQYASGSASVLNTFYFDFVAYPSTAYKVIAGMTHWNAAYGAYKECVQFNDSYTNISELSITNHTSAAGGSWAISRPNSTTLRVTHNGGNYDGGANFWIQVIGV